MIGDSEQLKLKYVLFGEIIHISFPGRDPCASNKCAQGSTCVSNDSGGYVCQSKSAAMFNCFSLLVMRGRD